MLGPSELLVLGEALAPPAGYEADALVAATYSLDLPLALALPLAVIRQGRFAGETAESADRYATLEAIRRLSSRYRVFCDAGGLLPGRRHRVLDLLSDVVVPVAVPLRNRRRPSFHPKFVLVRYVREAATTRMRLICMSRNLTGDAALDANVVLEGDVDASAHVEPGSGRLAAALRQLLAWAVNDEQAAGANVLINDIAGALQSTVWRIPLGFRKLAIWPLGFDDTSADPILPRADESRSVVMSPFLDESRLRALSGDDRSCTLISDALALDSISSETLASFTVRYLDPFRSPGNGLHAKLYIAETATRRRWIIGSANATTAAAQGNAELVIELEAGRNGPSATQFLSGDEGIGDLLMSYEVSDREIREAPTRSASEEFLRELSAHAFHATVEPEGAAAFTVRIRVDPPMRGGNAQIHVSLRGSASRARLDPEHTPSAVFRGVRRSQLSRYLNVEVQVNDEPPYGRMVVMTVEGIDLQELAREALADLLRDDGADPLAYLRATLSGGAPEALGLSFDDDDPEQPAVGDPTTAQARAVRTVVPILEPLLAALEDESGAVGDATILDDLTGIVDAFRSELPADFLELWDAIQVARTRSAGR